MLTFPPNITFAIQIAAFFILWWGLKRLLFDPVMHVLEAREARTTGLRAEAAGLRTAAERAASEYDRRMHDIRLQLATEAEEARASLAAEAQDLSVRMLERVSGRKL